MSKRPGGWSRLAGGLLAACVLAASPAFLPAKIDLVTLPNRDRTEITIYKSEDLTLVRETRALTFREGMNEIQFSWANTLIDPTSLDMRVVSSPGLYTLVDASYPANTRNTIIWNIEAQQAGSAEVEITYFASGLTWRADYAAKANDDETELVLEPKFRITNNSGEDFENAETRLVVGEINLVEAIRQLAERGLVDATRAREMRREVAGRAMRLQSEMDMAMPASPAPAGAFFADEEAKAIIKAAVSEYYLYTIEGTETIETGWSKQLPDPAIDGIPVELSYEYNPNRYGPGVVKFYKFKNDSEHGFGDDPDPLPEGTFYVYSEGADGGLRFQDMTTHKYVPVGQDVELRLGSDGMVLYEERVMDLTRTDFDFDRDSNVQGYREVFEYELEIRNSHGRDIPFKLTRPMPGGDWEVREASDGYKTVDRHTVEWEVTVPAQSSKTIAFTLVVNNGTLAKRN